MRRAMCDQIAQRHRNSRDINLLSYEDVKLVARFIGHRWIYVDHVDTIEGRRLSLALLCVGGSS